MKRFYCVTCGRVKRVRTLPEEMLTPIETIKISERAGVCDYHAHHTPRRTYQDRVRVHKVVTRRSPAPKPVETSAKPAKKGRKGRQTDAR